MNNISLILNNDVCEVDAAELPLVTISTGLTTRTIYVPSRVLLRSRKTAHTLGDQCRAIVAAVRDEITSHVFQFKQYFETMAIYIKCSSNVHGQVVDSVDNNERKRIIRYVGRFLYRKLKTKMVREYTILGDIVLHGSSSDCTQLQYGGATSDPRSCDLRSHSLRSVLGSSGPSASLSDRPTPWAGMENKQVESVDGFAYTYSAVAAPDDDLSAPYALWMNNDTWVSENSYKEMNTHSCYYTPRCLEPTP